MFVDFILEIIKFVVCGEIIKFVFFGIFRGMNVIIFVLFVLSSYSF